MDKEKKEQLVVKVCCVIAAFCLWLYVSYTENPIKEKKIDKVAVELMNVDKLEDYNKALYDDQEYYATLIVEASESVLRQVKADDFRVAVDFDTVNLNTGKARCWFEIIEAPDNVVISPKTQQWILIELDDLIEQEFVVNVNVEGSPKEGYYSHVPEKSLNTVVVEGPSRHVKLINEVVATVNIGGAEKDVISKVELKAVDMTGEEIKGVKIEPNEVAVTVPIKGSKEVPVEVQQTGGLSENIKLEKIESAVKAVKIIGDENVVKNISSIKTSPVDLSKITKNQTIELDLIVPEGVTINDGVSKVKVNISVKEILEKQVTSKIEVRNLNELYLADMEEQVVTLKLRGSEEELNKLNYDKIQSYIDLDGLEEGEHAVPINVDMPSGVNVEVAYKDISSIKVNIKLNEDVPTDNEDVDEEEDKNNSEDTGEEENSQSNINDSTALGLLKDKRWRIK